MANNYPTSITPKHGYHPRIDISKLLKVYPHLAVVRRCDITEPFAFSSTGNKRILKDDVFKSINPLQLSVNLIGGKFRIKHLSYKPILGKLTDLWDGVSELTSPINEDSYNVVPEYTPIYFRVKEINKFAFPYKKHFDSYASLNSWKQKISNKQKEHFEICKIITEEISPKNTELEVQATLKTNHYPTLANYWHTHIDTYACNSDSPLDGNNNNSETKRIRRSLREWIGRIAIEKLDCRYHIRHQHYRNDVCILRRILDFILNR